MGIKKITITLVAFCVFMGAAVGGAASAPVTNTQAEVAGASVVSTDDTTERISDCDVVDVDGHNNTVTVNITDNATADSGTTIQSHCESDGAILDHDLIDVDGNNNTVVVSVRAENGTVAFGTQESIDGNGLHVALGCEVGASNDCDGVDIEGHSNSVTLIIENNTDRTVRQFGSNTSTVSWPSNERDSAFGMTGANSRTDGENATTETKSESTNNVNRSGSEGEDSTDLLGMVADSIPLVGAVTMLILGIGLLTKRRSI